MKALCDAMGIESYYVHSTSNDHQWNLIRFGDGRLYHVDIDANKSAGKDVIYKSLSHPLPFDKTAYPTVGAVAQTQKNQHHLGSTLCYHTKKGQRLLENLEI